MIVETKRGMQTQGGTVDWGARYIQDRRVHDLDRWNCEEMCAGYQFQPG